MKVLIALLCFLFILGCKEESSIGQDESCYQGDSQSADATGDIFLIIGQSNAKSNAIFSTYESLDSVSVLDGCGNWKNATPRLDLYSNISRKQVVSHFGYSFGYEFAKQYKLYHSKPVRFISNARGGANIEFLIEVGIPETVKRIGDKNIKAVLYHQGESDFDNPEWINQAVYLVNEYRDYLGYDVPFIFGELCGGIYYRCQGFSDFNENIHLLEGILDNVSIVTTSGIDNSADVHFSKDQQIELGKRYFRKYIDMNIL